MFVQTVTPLGVAAAAPGILARPGAGVSRTPLSMMTFDAPGFGDLSEAVNIATGNVTLGTADLIYNSLLGKKDEKTATIGKSGWNFAPRMRLEGFTGANPKTSPNLIPNLDPGSASWIGYQAKPDIQLLNRVVSQDSQSCSPTGHQSGVMAIDSDATGVGQYRVSFEARTTGGTLSINYGLNDLKLTQANLTDQWKTFTADFLKSTTDADYTGVYSSRLFEVYENAKLNPSWEIGNITVQKFNSSTGAWSSNLVDTQDLRSAYWSALCSVKNTEFFYRLKSKDYSTASPYSGLIQTINPIKTPGKYRVSVDARSKGKDLPISYGLDDQSNVWRTLNNQWQTLTSDFTVPSGASSDRIFQILENQVANDDWEIQNFAVYRYTDGVDSNVSNLNLMLGDGGSSNFTLQDRSATSFDWTQKPSWIQRYKDVASAKLYAVTPEAGLQSSGEWIVLLPVDGRFIAHYYDAQGNRYTFDRDGEYVDYAQTLNQQYRSADQSDSEGLKGPRTEYGYQDPTSGRISKVIDEYGRVTSFTWGNHDGEQVLKKICYLNQKDGQLFGDSCARSVTFGYETVVPSGRQDLSQRVITWIRYSGSNGRGSGLLERFVDFNYKTNTVAGTPTVVLGEIKRNAPGTSGLERATTYDYNSSGYLTKHTTTGEPATTYDYSGVSTTYKGPIVKVTQAEGTTKQKTTSYQFDNVGQLRQKDVTDKNPVDGQSRTLSWKYVYYTGANGLTLRGNLGLIIDPTGVTTHIVYDTRGNVIREATYADSKIWSGETKLPVRVVMDSTFQSPQSNTPWITARKGEFTISATVSRDVLAQGLKWYSVDGNQETAITAVMGSGISLKSQVVSPANSQGNYTVTATFIAPDKQIQLKLRARSITDNNIFDDANVSISNRIRSIRIFPLYESAPLGEKYIDKVIVAPSCLKMRYGAAGLSENCQTSTPALTSEVNIADWATDKSVGQVKYVISKFSDDANAAGSRPILNSANQLVIPWYRAAAGKEHTVIIKAISPEEGSLATSTAEAIVNLGYFGATAATRTDGNGIGDWQTTMTSEAMRYQYGIVVSNAPFSKLSEARVAFYSNSGYGSFDPVFPGCLTTGYLASNANPINFGIYATVGISDSSYVYVTNNGSDGTSVQVSPRSWWDDIKGTRYDEVASCDNVWSQNKALSNFASNTNVAGSATLTLQALSGVPVKITPTTAQSFTTLSAAIDPDAPTDMATDLPVQPTELDRYLTATETTYDTDNRPLQVSRKGQVGANDVIDSHEYTDTTFTVSNQTFRTISKDDQKTYWSGVADANLKRTTSSTFGDTGLLTQQVVTWNSSESRTDTYSYYSAGQQATVTYPSGSGSTITPTEKQVTQYPDQVQSVTTTTTSANVTTPGSVTAKTLTYKYDVLGRPVEVQTSGKSGSTPTGAATSLTTVNGATTPGFETHTVQTAYNGFDQKIWERAKTGTDVARIQGWTYYNTGELANEWTGTPKNLTTYTYFTTGADAGRLQKLTRGVGDGNWTTTASVSTSHGATTYAYDEFGRTSSESVTRPTGTGNFTTSFEYDTLDRTVKKTLPDGTTIQTTKYDMYGEISETNEPKVKTTWTRERSSSTDYKLRVVQTTSPKEGYGSAVTLTTDYDEWDRPVNIASSDTSIVASAADNVTTMTYDPDGNRTVLVGPPLRTNADMNANKQWFTDNRRSAIVDTYDALGRKVKTTVALYGTVNQTTGLTASSSDRSVTTYAYDPFGNLTTQVDPNGYTTKFSYDALNQPFRTARQIWKTFAAQGALQASDKTTLDWQDGQEAVAWTAYDAAGHDYLKIDPGGSATRLYYNVSGFMLGVLDARGYVTKRYTYTPDGLQQGTYEPKIGSGSAAQIFSDPLVGDAFQLTEWREYGQSALPTGIRRATMNNQPSVDAATGVASGGALTSFTYAWSGKPDTTTYPDGRTLKQSYDYQGNVTSRTDPDGFTVDATYDANGGKLTETSRARTTAPGSTTDTEAGLSGGLTNTYTYDASGNMTSSLERGLETKFVYNSAGQVIAESRPIKWDSTLARTYKKYAYRLDGQKIAETSYAYVGNDLEAKQQASGGLAATISAVTFTSGNLTIYQRDPGGNVTQELSVTPTATAGINKLEKSVEQIYNGLSLRVFRNFQGDPATYLHQRDPNTGGFLSYANGGTSNLPYPYPYGSTDPITRQLTYWNYALNGLLLKKQDQVEVTSGTGSTRVPLNIFTYRYSPTGQPTDASRDVQIKVPRLPQGSAALTSDPILAGTVGHLESVYNERDLLATTRAYDRSPTTVSDLEAASATPQRTTDFTYYSDGHRASVTVAGQGTMTYEYDAMGRTTKTSDSNGAKRPDDSVSSGKKGTETNDRAISASLFDSVSDELKTDLEARGPASTSFEYQAGGVSKETLSWDATATRTACAITTTTTPTVGGLQYKMERTNTCDRGAASTTTIQKYDARGLKVQENGSGTGVYKADGRNASPAYPGTSWTHRTTSGNDIQYDDYYSMTSAKYDTSSVVNGYEFDDNGKEIKYDCVLDVNGELFMVAGGCSYSPKQYETVRRKNGTRTSSGNQSLINAYSSDGFLKSESTSSSNLDTTPLRPGEEPHVATQTNTTKTYTLNSRGQRIKTASNRSKSDDGGFPYVEAGESDGYIKQYDADDKVALYYRFDQTTKQASYADFRYDPQGQTVLSSTSAYRHDANGYVVERDFNARYYSGSEVQMVRKRTGRLGKNPSTQATYFLGWTITPASDGTFDSYVGNNQIQDLTFSAADAVVDTTKWEAVQLFDARANAGAQLFEAPTPATSTKTGVDPTRVEAPKAPAVPVTPAQPAEPQSDEQTQQMAPVAEGQAAGTIQTQSVSSVAHVSSDQVTGAVVTSGSADQKPSQSANVELSAPQNVLPTSVSSVTVQDVTLPQANAAAEVPTGINPIEVKSPLDAALNQTPATIVDVGQIGNTDEPVKIMPPGLISVGDRISQSSQDHRVRVMYDPNALPRITYDEYIARTIGLAASLADQMRQADNEQKIELGGKLDDILNIISLNIINHAASSNWGDTPGGMESLERLVKNLKTWNDPVYRVRMLETLSMVVDGPNIDQLDVDQLNRISALMEACQSRQNSNNCNTLVPTAYTPRNSLNFIAATWRSIGWLESDDKLRNEYWRRQAIFAAEIAAMILQPELFILRGLSWLIRGTRLARAGIKLAELSKNFIRGHIDNLVAKALEDGVEILCRVNSFAPNTPVRTLSGLVAISALTVGTPVLAFNEQTGQNGYYPITAVHRNQDPEITYLTLTDPDQKDKLEFIETTPEHPFYVVEQVDTHPRPAPEGHGDLNRHWVGAGHLKIGDMIKQADGTIGLVANVTTVQQTREMFNLTVSEAHTYYVGQDGWLVHNVNDTASALKFLDSFDAAFSSTTKPTNMTSSQLKNIVAQLYKPGGSVGDGFTESAAKIEKILGLKKIPGVRTGHGVKIDEIIAAIDNALSGKGKNKPGYIAPDQSDIIVLQKLRAALVQVKNTPSLFLTSLACR